METGQVVRVKGYDGEDMTRRVVSFDENTVAVCKEEEYQKALVERRQPLSVGVKRKYVMPE